LNDQAQGVGKLRSCLWHAHGTLGSTFFPALHPKLSGVFIMEPPSLNILVVNIKLLHLLHSPTVQHHSELTGILIIGLGEPESMRSSKILYLIQSAIFGDMQAVPSPLVVRKRRTGVLLTPSSGPVE
jgi:hypothetical protein